MEPQTALFHRPADRHISQPMPLEPFSIARLRRFSLGGTGLVLRPDNLSEAEPTFRPLLSSLCESISLSGCDRMDRGGPKQPAGTKKGFRQTVERLCRRQNTESRFYEEIEERNPMLSFDANLANAVIVVRPKTSFEQVDSLHDSWPWLAERQALLRIWAGFRQLCLFIVSSSPFQTFIILAILLNTVLLALEDPSLDTQPDPYPTMELVLLYIYTVEMGLKMLALGLVLGKKTYFRDTWNILDAVVVATGWIELEYTGSGVNISALRALRILRPLRSITRVEGMKIVFASLMGSVRMLASAVALLSFYYLISGIGTLQMFMGALKQRCVDIETGDVTGASDDSDICGSRVCETNHACAKGLNNPNFGHSHFDNLFISMLTIFQSVTLEGWTPVMINLEKAVGMWIVVLYIPIVYLGAFFFMNMTVVAMNSSVSATQFAAATKTVRDKKPNDEESEEEEAQTAVLPTETPQAGPLPPRLLPRALNSGFFLVEQDSVRLNMKGNQGNIRTLRRVTSRDSEDSFQIDREEPFRSVDLVAPAHSSGSVASISLFSRAKTPLQDDPMYTEEPEVLTLRPKETNPALFEKETAREVLFAPEELLKSALLQMRKKKKSKWDPKHTAYSLSDTFELTFSSKDDVTGTADLSRKPVEPRNEPFHYVNSDETQEKLPDFSEFMSLCRKMKSKEAYLKANSLASQLFDPHFFAQSYSGPSSIADVKGNTAFLIDINRLNGMKVQVWRPGLGGKVQRCVQPCAWLVGSSLFNYFMTLCIALNTLVLALNHYGIDQDMASVLDTANLTFTIIFAAEMGLKIIGLGVIGYFRDKMNDFDCIIVTFSIIELVFLSGSGLSALRALRVFRAFRAFRVARLFRTMNYMQVIMQKLSESFSNFMYVGLLLLLFIVVFALLGMQLFGGQFDFPEGRPRSNYDNFHYAFLTTFQLLTEENWFMVLYNGMRTNMGNVAALYFIVWIFLGNFVLLNLFVAVLLDSFSSLSDEDNLTSEELTKLLSEKSTFSRQSSISNFTKERKRQIEFFSKKAEEIREEDSEDSASASQDSAFARKKTKNPLSGNQCDRSFFLFTKTSCLRRNCTRFTCSNRFEWGILTIIFISSLKLIWETYLFEEPPESTKLVISSDLDIFFTCVFLCEFLLKAITLGFVLDKGTYLRDSWNILDFVIIIFSLLDISTSGMNLAILKVFRLLRALRPLRFISHNKSMRIIVNALIESMSALANAAAMFLIIMLIFGILGVTLLMGKEYNCSNEAFTLQTDCERYGYAWQNSPNHFDNVIVAYHSLFIIVSQENWPEQMYQGTDAHSAGHAMVRDYNPTMAYFFVAFSILGNILFLNLLIAILFDKFERAKKRNSSISELLLQNEQLRWVETMKYIIRTKRVEVKAVVTSCLQQQVIRLISHWSFEAFIMACIFGNMLTMALLYDEASANYVLALENINYAFTSVFCIEAVLKLYGLTPVNYFRSRWNCFDFGVVFCSLLEIILNLTVFQGGSNTLLRVGPQLVRVFRILRVSRLLRLVKKLRMIDDLVGMMALSIPAIMNVFLLLMLVFIIYGILGVYLFRSTKLGLIVDDYNNFWTFGQAILILIKISTGEDWNYIDYDLTQDVNSWLAAFYFQSFVCFTTFIMYNMFIMVMLQEYENYHNNPDNSFAMYKEKLLKFNKAWNQCVKDGARMRIDGEGLLTLAREMGTDIGLKEGKTDFEVRKYLNLIGLTMDNQGFVYYHEALFRCFRRIIMNKKVSEPLSRKIIEKEENFYTKQLRKLVKIDKMNSMRKLMQVGQSSRSSDMNLLDLVFAKSVFASWKGYAKQLNPARPLSPDTPALGANDPGKNSPEGSILVDSPENQKSHKEKLRKTSTLMPPSHSSTHDVKYSRSSTNFSRPRDTQES